MTYQNEMAAVESLSLNQRNNEEANAELIESKDQVALEPSEDTFLR